MALSKEELLKPRYKVIADYPGNIYSQGQILKEVSVHLEKFVAEGHDQNFQYVERPALYPAVFRKLEWWEDRKAEEMPEYYAYSGNHGVFKTSFAINGDVVMLNFSPTETVPTKLQYCQPSTEEEYNQYIQKHTTNG